jgi:hypothetical protein
MRWGLPKDTAKGYALAQVTDAFSATSHERDTAANPSANGFWRFYPSHVPLCDG